MTFDRTGAVAAFVAASLAYIGVTLGFTGGFDVRGWAVFAVSFLFLLAAGDRLFDRFDA